MGILPDWMIELAKPVSPLEPCVKRPGKTSYGLTSYGYDARVGYKFKVFTPALCAEVDPKNFDPDSFVEVDITPHDGGHSILAGKAVSTCAFCGLHHRDWVYTPDCAKRPVPPNYVRIPPNSFALCESVETFKIPRDTLAVVVGKSTYARCGIIVNVTPLEPEWEGTVTVEISNTTPLPARIYGGEGIMQILFFKTAGIADAVVDFLKQNPDPMRNHALDSLLQQSVCRVSYVDKGGKYQGQSGVELPKIDW